MEAARTSETLVNFYRTTQRYNPEDSYLQTENLFFPIFLQTLQSFVILYSTNYAHTLKDIDIHSYNFKEMLEFYNLHSGFMLCVFHQSKIKS
jgi:hypothetical protein